jgi:hypothetical protein
MPFASILPLICSSFLGDLVDVSILSVSKKNYPSPSWMPVRGVRFVEISLLTGPSSIAPVTLRFLIRFERLLLSQTPDLRSK